MPGDDGTKRSGLTALLPHAGLALSVSGGLAYLTALMSIHGLSTTTGVTASELGIDLRSSVAMALVWFIVALALILPFLVSWVLPDASVAMALTGGLIALAVSVVLPRLLLHGNGADAIRAVSLIIGAVFVSVLLVGLRVQKRDIRTKKQAIDRLHEEAREAIGRVDAVLSAASRERITTGREVQLPTEGARQLERDVKLSAQKLRDAEVIVESIAEPSRLLLFVVAAVLLTAPPYLAYQAGRDWGSRLVADPASEPVGPLPLGAILPTTRVLVTSGDGIDMCALRLGTEAFITEEAVVVLHDFTRIEIAQCDL